MSGSDAFTSLDLLLTQRHSCRAFLNRPVARTLVERVVETAQKCLAGVIRNPGS